VPEEKMVSAHEVEDGRGSVAIPPVVDRHSWDAALADLRAREKAATRELDAIAAARRRLPMVELPEYTLEAADGPVRLTEVFEGRRQLIVYHHVWFPGEEWQCSGCTGFTSQFTRLEFLESYDARFVIVTQGPIDEALAYQARVGNKMTWYSTAHSSFGADMGAPPGGGGAQILTTGLWYHRLCRSIGDRTLIGVFSPGRGRADPVVAAGAIEAVTGLPDSIGLVSLRELAWPMARLIDAGVRLNVMSLEALAAAEHLAAELCLARADENPPLLAAAQARGTLTRLLG
jgi:predicted dithiol-disulfide oxidoreductase (DUF899 family)